VQLVGQSQSTSDPALDLSVVRASVRRGRFQLDFSPALTGVGQQEEILRHRPRRIHLPVRKPGIGSRMVMDFEHIH
jgi:hypothetical protein